MNGIYYYSYRRSQQAVRVGLIGSLGATCTALAITLVCLPVLPFQARAADKLDPVSSQDLPCRKPDDSLLHQGGFRGLTMPVNEKVEKYNKQVHAFNDCTRALIDKNYAEIDHIRADAMAAIRLITDTANAQIVDIRVKIGNAKSGAAAGYSSQPILRACCFPRPNARRRTDRCSNSCGKTTEVSDQRVYETPNMGRRKR